MSFTIKTLQALDAEGGSVLRRALATYSDDVAGDLAEIERGLAAGSQHGLLLLGEDDVAGVAVWRYEDSAQRYAAVDVLHLVVPEAAAALVAAVWDTLMESAELEMISARVREATGDDDLRSVLETRGAVLFTRKMMVFDLPLKPFPAASLPDGYSLERWEDAHQSQVEAIAVRVQADSVDAVVMPDAQPERMAEALRQIRAGTFPNAGPCIPEATLVLLDGSGAVCGYIATVDMGMLAFVMDVAVHPDHQRRGLGRQIMLAAMEALKAADYPMLGLAVTGRNPAVRLYEGLDFRVAQQGETAVWWRDGRQQAWA